MITLLMLTDGRRECFQKTLASAKWNLIGPISELLVINDSADLGHDAWLKSVVGSHGRVVSHSTKRGFCGAVQSAWSDILTPFVFHLEDDFIFNKPVNLQAMVEVLQDNPHLVQLALRRQPWNDAERAAGGIVEMWPAEYEEKQLGLHSWLEHRLFFTTNPCLYRRELTERGWPNGPRCEETFTTQVLEDSDARFGFWGARDSGEAVFHIGDERVGTGY